MKSRKYNLKRIIIRFLFIITFLFLSLIYIVKKYSNQFCYKNINNIPSSSVGLILGAGINNQSPSIYLQDRLDKAIELYTKDKVKTLLISGDDGNDRDDEITAMKNYLLAHNIPQDKILIDTAGYNTYSSMYRAKNIFGLDTITIITQNYHLDRSVFIARVLGLYSYGYIADTSEYQNQTYFIIREYFAIIKACWDVSRKRTIH